MKNLSTYDTHGMAIHRVFLGNRNWEALPTKSVVPPSSKLLNFEVKAKGYTWLVLDNYGVGDDSFGSLASVFAKKVFGDTFWRDTIAIEKKTGQVMRAVFYMLDDSDAEGAGLAMGVFPLVEDEACLCMPRPWRRRIGELLSQKRPFSLSLPPGRIADYHDREIARHDLVQELVVCFHFDNGDCLEMWKDMYRTTTEWA